MLKIEHKIVYSKTGKNAKGQIIYLGGGRGIKIKGPAKSQHTSENKTLVSGHHKKGKESESEILVREKKSFYISQNNLKRKDGIF